mgnify:CR=1 FL=1
MNVDFELLRREQKLLEHGDSGDGSASGTHLDKPFKLNVQDCAGQAIFMRALHVLLFAPDAIYMVVFSMHDLQDDPGACLDEVYKWLGMVHVNAPGAPIILVGTHKDQVADDNRRVYKTIPMSLPRSRKWYEHGIAAPQHHSTHVVRMR